MNKWPNILDQAAEPGAATGANRTDRRDLICVVMGALVSFVLASVLMTGWPAGLIPNLASPYVYSQDALFQYWMTQRVMEGWVFDNARSGFPFGSPSFDYPGSDAANLLLGKLLGKLLGTYFAAANAYFLLGFAATFAATFWVLRKFSIRRDVAFAASMLFAFTPYHFARLLVGHTFYTWYFVVPLYVYVGFTLLEPSRRLPGYLKCCAALLLASCFGVYFAFFGALVILTCGLAASARLRALRPMLLAFGFCAAISIGVLCNLAPSAAYTAAHGKNPEVAARSPVETETYAMKLTHMLMPHQEHRIGKLREAAAHYAKSFPLLNNDGSVGLAGLIGLVVLLVAFVRSSAGAVPEPRIGVLVLLTGMTIVFSMVGGLNTLFALWVTPLIRGWERFTIFVAFFAITAMAVVTSQLLQDKRVEKRWLPAAAALLALFLFIEQTAAPGVYRAYANSDSFVQDRAVVQEIEASLPARSAIYQLPYIDFPEVAPLHRLGPYDPLTGFLNSRQLRWSAGGMKGREAAVFYKALAQKPMAEQIDTARKMSFAGIYVDRRGYADNGVGVLDELASLLGHGPDIYRKDGGIVFFKLDR